MPRRLLVAVAAAATLVIALVVWFGSKGTPRRAGRTASVGPSARAAFGAEAMPQPGLSWLAQRGATARRVAGRVVFEGKPVAGATVRLGSRARRGAMRAVATTGDDGAFDLGPQAPLEIVVSASADGKADAIAFFDLRNPAMRPSSDAIVLELRPCVASIHGFVLDASSGAIPGAVVHRGTVDSVAGADGAYNLCVPIGEISIEVGADGYGTVALSLAVTNRVRRDFRLSPEGVIAGRAVRAGDGAPVENAVVSLQPSGSVMPGISGAVGGAPAYATTDAEGRFRIAGVLPGRRQVTAAAEGLHAPLTDVNVVAGDGGEEVTITLEPAAAVAGRVVDEAGAGVAGARVTLADQDRVVFGAREGASAISQDDGGFVIDGVRPGSYALDVTPFSAAGTAASSLDVPEKGISDLTLVVERGSLISGTVTRAGKPVGGARVYVQGGGRGQAQSEADGRFTLRGFPPGTHELYAESLQDGAFNRGPTVVVEKGKDVTGVVIELALASSIAGTVVDQHGAPVSGAYLSFQLATGGDYGESTTAEDGSFKATAMSGGGDYRVSIMASRSSSLRFLPVTGDDFPAVAVPDGDTHVTGVRYAVTVDKLAISGKVVDEKGAPLPDVRVEATPYGDRGWDMGETPAAVTDTDGAFAIGDLLAGDYHVDARAGNGGAARSAKPIEAGAKNVKLTLTTPGMIEGTLEGFTRPPRVIASGYLDNRSMDETLTAEVTGTTFRIRGAPPGQYVVAAIGGGIVGDEELVEVKGAQTAKVALAHRGSGSIKGTVIDGDGKPVRGARCSVAGMSSGGNQAVSDEQGAFSITPAAVGQSAIYCGTMTTMQMGFAQVTVAAGEIATVAVTVADRRPPEPKATIGATFVQSPAGPRVSALVDDGPAAKAGMKVRDVVLGIAEFETSYRELDGPMMERMIGRFDPGTTLTFRLRRGTETVELPVTVAARP